MTKVTQLVSGKAKIQAPGFQPVPLIVSDTSLRSLPA